ncbi:MAG TPA: galactokinase [Clostridiales bacterium]|nr:galactokinase [Clostridiales bacterium]
MKNRMLLEFENIFGNSEDIKVFFAPGRVNLIGEHTDYNGGHVFPCSLTVGTYAAVRERNDRNLNLYSVNFEELGIIKTSLDKLVYDKADDWANYVKGVIWAFEKENYICNTGFDVVFYGNIPNKSGLSSSASLEVLTGFFLKTFFKFNIELKEIALLSQMAENEFVGVNCGIMDQFAIAMGKKDNAIFLNTSNLEYKYAPIKLEDAKIVIINTNKQRALEDSKYNERRKECEEALNKFKEVINIDSLADLTEKKFEANKHILENPLLIKRAKHAVYENQRTIKAVKCLENNDIEQFGELMNQSHISLKDDYEVTGIELDTIVEAAWLEEGVVGARMTGAGFGGCAVSIVKEESINRFIENLGNHYKKTIGYEASFYIVEIGNGPIVL